MRRKLAILTLALGALLVGTAVVAVETLDQWLFDVLDPGPFDPAKTPPAPDYTTLAAWAAHPDENDASDPAGMPSTDAQTFYVHPTTWMGPEWNGPTDDPVVREATRVGGTLIQGRAFGEATEVWAPYYRQVNGRALLLPSPDGQRALDVAFEDLSAAFDVFLSGLGDAPFILASHSQGSVHAARLVRERIAGAPLARQLAVAYLIGGPLRERDLGGLPVCATPDQTGCAVVFNARPENFEPNGLEFAGADSADPWICVNPLTWRRDETLAPTSAHLGARFLDEVDTELRPNFLAARCDGSYLVVTELGELKRDPASRILMHVMGSSYHPIEYQLFWENLRANTVARISAWSE